MSRLKPLLAQALAEHARRRMRRTHPEWAEAMAAEVEHLGRQGTGFRWAAGCVGASYRTDRTIDGLRYLAALALGLAAMTFDQWVEDEGAGTCLVLGLVTLLLGVLSPRRFVLSGIAVGGVVAGVHVFGALTGVRPPYETTAHGLVGGLRWLVFVLPAIGAAAVGSRLGRTVRPS